MAICAKCGVEVADAEALMSPDGMVCETCHYGAAAEAAAGAGLASGPKTLLGMGVVAAVIPFGISYRETTVKTPQSVTHTTETRILIFTNAKSSTIGFALSGGGAVSSGGKSVSSHDYVGIAVGGIALLLGFAAIVSVFRAATPSNKAKATAVVVLLLGAWHLINGFGLV